MECFGQAYFAQLQKNAFRHKEQNRDKYQTNYSIARLTGMTKQARGREHQTRGDLSKTF